MSLIQVTDLTFAYPGSFDNVFDRVSFQIDTDWKLGLAGRNGRGKTTLLRLFLGEFEYGGSISASVDFACFPCRIPDPERKTGEVLRGLCPQAESWELLRELALLEVEEDALYRPYGTLSKGEQTKAQLAALFLQEGRFPLLDEPTNHLDARGRDLAAAYLRRKRGFLLVSHDRHFLDGCVDHILALNRADIQLQRGNFSSWMENFRQTQESELARRDLLQKEIRQLRQSARQTAAWSDKVEKSKFGVQSSGLKADRGFVGRKAAKMMKRAKSLESRQQKALEEKEGLLKNQEAPGVLKLAPLVHHAPVLVQCEAVSVLYDGHPVCAPVSFTVGRGERVLLEGRNGSGKSSLLKLILGRNLDHTGTVSLASGLKISHVPQSTEHLRGSLEDFIEAQEIDGTLLRAILRNLGLERVQFEKDLAGWSEGQKKEVLLAASLCEQAHLYVWDEPLNYIDVYARMQIEDLIREFRPAMLLVEHDRAFQEAAATKRVMLTSGK